MKKNTEEKAITLLGLLARVTMIILIIGSCLGFMIKFANAVKNHNNKYAKR